MELIVELLFIILAMCLVIAGVAILLKRIDLKITVNVVQDAPEIPVNEPVKVEDPYDKKGDLKEQDEDEVNLDDILHELHEFMSED